MPIRRVGRSRCTDTRDNGRQRIRAVTCPQRDGLGVKVDIIGEIVPVASFELCGPFGRSAHTPTQCVVFTGRVAAQQTVLELGEVALYPECQT